MLAMTRWQVSISMANRLGPVSRTNGWTEERRQRQRELIQRWKPWEKSTGPRTAEGKAKVARNSYKGGVRPLLRKLSKALKEQTRCLE
jgi:hypothetical protein